MRAVVALLCIVFGSASSTMSYDGPPSGDIYFRAGFDDGVNAELRGNAIRPRLLRSAEFTEGLDSKAVVLGRNTVLEYDLTGEFPSEAGTLEVRFRPMFAQSPTSAARTILRLSGEDGASLALGFQPQGVRWAFQPTVEKWQRTIAASNFNDEARERWTTLTLTWDRKAKGGPKLRFYRDGRFDRHRTEEFAAPLGKLTKLVVGGDVEGDVATDEIVVYSTALSAGDVEFLHAAASDSARFAKLSEHRAAEEKRRLAEQAAHHARLAKLQGRVAYLINPRGGKVREYRLPGGIVAQGVRVEDVGKVDLAQYSAVYGPPGAGYQLDAQQIEVIRNYLKAGGGYVGVCAGANFAGRAKLLDMTTHSFKNQGLLTIGVSPHAVTKGFTGEVVIHHGNGPIMVPGPGCQAIGEFLIGQKFPIKTAAIVAGSLGDGRVVAFGPHPTGGGVEYQSRGAKFAGSELGTDALLVNALLWAAKLTD
jgi:hypothetical protein